MKRFSWIGAALIAAASHLAIAQAQSPVSPIPRSGVVGQEDASREVLVSFVDRGIQRPSFGGPGSYVRRGDDYDATAWSHQVGASIAQRHRLRTVTEWPILSLGAHCIVFAVDDDRTIDDVVSELQHDREVGSAQPMSMFRVLSGDPYAPLQRSIRGMNVELAHRVSTGRGVTIAIVDTGVDFHHPDLAGQIARHTDLANRPGGPSFDNDIHGTAVAGVIAALAGNGQGIVGVAPQAQLYVFRACWPVKEGEPGAICNSLSVASALDAAIRSGPRVINLSLTGPADPLVGQLVEAALQKGILVVLAEPPSGGAASRLAWGLEGVIRVRAAGLPSVDEPGTVVVTAPGTDVLTTFPHGTYNFISGSSFAAANVSGVIALLLQSRPEATRADVLAALESAARTDAADGTVDGIDACMALAHLGAASACPK